MPQISKYRLDKTIQAEMFRRFWDSIARLRDPRAVSDFFSDLLTRTEGVMLAKRLTIAVLILRGKKPVEIAEVLHVSFSTIGRVETWVDRAKPGTLKELETLSKEASWQLFFDKIDQLFDRLPPAYGTDWRRAGQGKSQRAKERAMRSSIG